MENLRTYKQPVIVYLPPGAELRGGAWVVVDGQINSQQVLHRTWHCLTAYVVEGPITIPPESACPMERMEKAASSSHVIDYDKILILDGGF